MNCPTCGEHIGEGEIYCCQCGRKNDEVLRCKQCHLPLIIKEHTYECTNCNIVYGKI